MILLRLFTLFITALLIAITEVASGHSHNDMTLVFMFPVIKEKGSGINTLDIAGVKRLAAALMGVRHINNKTDGFYDDLILPRFKFVFYDSKRSTERSWWNTAEFSSIYHQNKQKENFAIVGPASSSPSLHVNRALQDGNIQVVQIGYSATSPKLTKAQLFARSVPNDKLKADVLYDRSFQGRESFFSLPDTW